MERLGEGRGQRGRSWSERVKWKQHTFFHILFSLGEMFFFLHIFGICPKKYALKLNPCGAYYISKESFESLNHITVAMVLLHFLDSFRNMHGIVEQLPLKVSRSLLTRNHSSSLFPDFCSSVSYIF